jgi:hypothetical protein
VVSKLGQKGFTIKTLYNVLQIRPPEEAVAVQEAASEDQNFPMPSNVGEKFE